jgi:hypothetical protein
VLWVTCAAGLALLIACMAMTAAIRRRSEAFRRLTWLAREVDRIAESIETDLQTIPRSPEAERLRRNCLQVASAARSWLRKNHQARFIRPRPLLAARDGLHDDHGLIVQLRSVADAQLAGFRRLGDSGGPQDEPRCLRGGAGKRQRGIHREGHRRAPSPP